MATWVAMLWGTFGMFAIEALDLSRAIHRVNGWPWKKRGEPDFGPYLVSVILRLLVSGGVAAASAASAQVDTVFAALAAGVAAPLLLQTLARQLPAGVEADTDTSADSPPEPTLPGRGQGEATVLQLPGTGTVDLASKRGRGRGRALEDIEGDA